MHSDVLVYRERFEEPDVEQEIYPNLANLWPDWHSQANCLGSDERIFFGSSSPQERPAYTISEIKAAKATCVGCPVFEQCLRQAFRNREIYGVWAGTTMKERLEWFKLIQNEKRAEEEIIQEVLDERTGQHHSS